MDLAPRSGRSRRPRTAARLGDETTARCVTIGQTAGRQIVEIDILDARAGDTIVAGGVIEPEGETDLRVELATLAVDRAAVR